jgi:DNA topoisomerase I
MAVTAPRRQRLRRSDCTAAGVARRRRGRGFVYLDADGNPVTDPALLERIAELVIPPAWSDVWICPFPEGHIQATGVDARGRKQYLYHRRWRERRDQRKFDEMIAFARALPELRRRVDEDLARNDLSREQVLACAVRLLDRGLFRIGSEQYAVTNETYGLATMHKRHVRVDGEELLFNYPAKHGKRLVSALVDAEVASLVRRLKSRRGSGEELLAYKAFGRWHDIRSTDINTYVKEQTGLDASAKDFRTWGATVLAAVALAASDPGDLTASGRKRQIAIAVKRVALQLGNTPAVARGSYIDPRVFDRYRDGYRVDPALIDGERSSSALQGEVEDAVLDLVSGERRSPLLKRVRAPSGPSSS